MTCGKELQIEAYRRTLMQVQMRLMEEVDLGFVVLVVLQFKNCASIKSYVNDFSQRPNFPIHKYIEQDINQSMPILSI